MKILVLCAVLAAGVLAMIYFTREPTADGRALSEWLHVGWDNRSGRDNSDVTNAIRKIGVNGVPVLLDKARVQDSAWKLKLQNAGSGYGFPKRWLFAASYQRAQATYGFSVLGTQAVSAIPELSQMLFDTNIDTSAGTALGLIGPESLPVLGEALTNGNENIRLRAAYGITATRDVARLALSEVLALRHETNELIALIVLDRIGPLLPESELLPVAVAFLQGSRPHVQLRALRVMARVRTNSAVAFPSVLPFLTNSIAGVRKQASNTLVAIDPVIAAAHGVNTNWDGGQRIDR